MAKRQKQCCGIESNSNCEKDCPEISSLPTEGEAPGARGVKKSKDSQSRQKKTPTRKQRGERHDVAPAGPRTNSAQIEDGLSLWDDAIKQSGATKLPLVRLSENECLLILFTTSLARVRAHYLDIESLRGYVACNGAGCVLCAAGRKVGERDLLPVYDVVNRVVAVLSIGPDLRAQGLRPQLHPLLQRVSRDEAPFLTVIYRTGYGNHTVTTTELPEGADDGARDIAGFLEQLSGETVDLASAFEHVTNDVLAEIPEIKLALQAKGLVA